MDRGASAGVITELGKSRNQPIHLAQAIFDSETAYMTDAYQPITWSGHTYTALGYFLGFSDIEESADLMVQTVTISLSGVGQEYISAFLNYGYIDRTVRIYKAFLDEDDALVSDPFLIFEGRMDSPVIQEDPDNGACTVAVTATNQWVDFERKAGRHTNHEEQQIHFPGDMFFEFASEIVKDVIWGKK